MAGSLTPTVGESLQLDCFDHFPDQLMDVAASKLWRYLRGPSLFHLPGRQGEPLFVSVLLHGNEDTGWRAVQTVLRQHRGTTLARPLLVFVGNIEAAKAKVRTLPHQEDYNRAWPGTPRPDTPLARLMRDVVETASREPLFASIDIHNNSGHNPHYACVNSLAEAYLHLARLFSRTVIFFQKPVGVQSAAFGMICPAVTVECGRAGVAAGVVHAAELISSALALQHFPDHRVADGDIDLIWTFAIVKVPADATLSYDGSEADFRLRADLDQLNFSELHRGTVFGTLGGRGGRRLDVLLVDGKAGEDGYFEYVGVRSGCRSPRFRP